MDIFAPRTSASGALVVPALDGVASPAAVVPRGMPRAVPFRLGPDGADTPTAPVRVDPRKAQVTPPPSRPSSYAVTSGGATA